MTVTTKVWHFPRIVHEVVLYSFVCTILLWLKCALVGHPRTIAAIVNGRTAEVILTEFRGLTAVRGMTFGLR